MARLRDILRDWVPADPRNKLKRSGFPQGALNRKCSNSCVQPSSPYVLGYGILGGTPNGWLWLHPSLKKFPSVQQNFVLGTYYNDTIYKRFCGM